MRQQRRYARTLGCVLALGSLGACKDYEPRDYVAACTDNKPVEHAAPYDPSINPGLEFPLFMAEKRADIKHWIWGDTPRPLAEIGAVPTDRKNHERTQLLVCVEQEERAFGRDCDMSGRTVKMYDAGYKVTLREARTAKVLAQKTFESRVKGECPREVLVSPTEKEPKRYAPMPMTDVTAMIVPHLPAAVRARLEEAAK